LEWLGGFVQQYDRDFEQEGQFRWEANSGLWRKLQVSKKLRKLYPKGPRKFEV
jgi:hypothetical protein